MHLDRVKGSKMGGIFDIIKLKRYLEEKEEESKNFMDTLPSKNSD
jgi:hypothetical protein